MIETRASGKGREFLLIVPMGHGGKALKREALALPASEAGQVEMSVILGDGMLCGHGWEG